MVSRPVVSGPSSGQWSVVSGPVVSGQWSVVQSYSGGQSHEEKPGPSRLVSPRRRKEVSSAPLHSKPIYAI